MIRTVVCHESPVVREGLRALLASEAGVEVVETTGSAAAAVHLASTLRPEVLVTGLSLAGGSGLDVLGRVGAMQPPGTAPGFVVLVAADDEPPVSDILAAGASALVLADTEAEDLVLAVRCAARDALFVAPALARFLAVRQRREDHADRKVLRARLTRLTAREDEVMRMLARGLSNEEVAEELAIAITTVRTHIYRAKHKLDITTRTQLVALAFQSGIVT